MSTEVFTHDLFPSHSATDKAVLRSLAERLRKGGPFNFGTRNLEFGIPQVGTFRFRDPPNQERRFSGLLHSTFCLSLAPPSKAPWHNSFGFKKSGL